MNRYSNPIPNRECHPSWINIILVVTISHMSIKYSLPVILISNTSFSTTIVFSKFTLSVKFSLLHLNISYNLHNIPEQTGILTGNIPVNIPAFLLLEVNNYFGNLYLHTTNNEVAMKSHKPNYQYFTDIGPALSQSKTRLYYRLELNVLGQTKRKKKSVCISFFFKRLFSL